MNQFQTDELVYYKINDELYSGGFQINAMHHTQQGGGNTTSYKHLAIPLGLYTKNPTLTPLHLNNNSQVIPDNYYSNNKTKRKH
jgi:hypothetical protein